MRKLIVHEWISLDGYAADKNGQLDFFTRFSSRENKDSDLDILEFINSLDLILLGRKTYELFADFWPGATTDTEIIADKLNTTPKIVFSSSIQTAPWGNWQPVTVLSGNAMEHIRRLKDEPGKDMVIWGSLSLVKSAEQENLVDEYHLHLCPTLTGGGIPLFPSLDGYKELQLFDLKKYATGVCVLKYARK